MVRRLRLLEGLYAIHGRFTADLESWACRLHCDTCCTRSVTMTTLEGIYLLDGLQTTERRRLITTLREQADEPRYIPKLTTNMLARYCMEGREPPQESQPVEVMSCPLLAAQACPVYDRRPFGCRCFVSRRRCDEQGYADVDEWVLTANTVLMQTIEQLDRPGCFGNFSDVLLAIDGEGTGIAGETRSPACDAVGLLTNQPTAALMIPPAHRNKVRPLLKAIQALGSG